MCACVCTLCISIPGIRIARTSTFALLFVAQPLLRHLVCGGARKGGREVREGRERGRGEGEGGKTGREERERGEEEREQGRGERDSGETWQKEKDRQVDRQTETEMNHVY